MREALLRSGYLLEGRLFEVLGERGNVVATPNVAYVDPVTSKTRELDLTALAFPTLSGPQVLHPNNLVYGLLLVECVRNPQPLVFFTREAEINVAMGSAIHLAGVPTRLDNDENLISALQLRDFHHLAPVEEATQFCSFVRKKDPPEWMATHVDEHFDSFRTLCDALDYTMTRDFNRVEKGPSDAVELTFYYPMLVLEGGLMTARTTSRSVSFASADALMFRRPAVVRGREIQYGIDVVTERHFAKVLDQIEEELLEIQRRIGSRSPDIARAAVRQRAAIPPVNDPLLIRASLEPIDL